MDEFVIHSETNVSDMHSYKSCQSNYRDTIQLYDVIPYHFMNYSTPLVYFVDYFPSLQNNTIWKNMRNTQNDLIYDATGNIVFFDDLVNGLYIVLVRFVLKALIRKINSLILFLLIPMDLLISWK